MADGSVIKDGILKKYYEHSDTRVVIPDGVTVIGEGAFAFCQRIRSVRIPESVREIRKEAFDHCRGLGSVTVPEGVTVIEDAVFRNCASLTAVRTGSALERIGANAFSGCGALKSFHITDTVRGIGDGAFSFCGSLETVTLPAGIDVIGDHTFYGCGKLESVGIPDSIARIGSHAFEDCGKLTAFDIPGGVTFIGEKAFSGCVSLPLMIVHDTVKTIGENAFSGCPGMTVICGENSAAHRYCEENRLWFLFDYQFKAFHGLLPPGVEKLASPFLADEEKPYIFISYSHKDRDAVLPILKTLYESGWRIWYDEGLTIGDEYDVTLEEHVRASAAFLLFVTKNTVKSRYCLDNEIPWAVKYDRPIVKCVMDKGADIRIDGGRVSAPVQPRDIEPALEGIGGLTRGAKRTAAGISVAVDPSRRDDGGGTAYCLYADDYADIARAILLEARNSGCALYDPRTEGENEEKLCDCPCLIVFLDRAFLMERRLTGILTDAYLKGRDLAVCQLEDLTDDDLPSELRPLHQMQWLNFVHGLDRDMLTKLSRHLQERGCRETAVLPGFDYEDGPDGITIKRYTGTDPTPSIARECGGRPVTAIGDEAFMGCGHLRSVTLPDGIRSIGKSAFADCVGLTEISLPHGVTRIGDHAFCDCRALKSVNLPDGITQIEEFSFFKCAAIGEIGLPEGVTSIGRSAFAYSGLRSLTLRGSVARIDENAFLGCESLETVVIPSGVETIGHMAFSNCRRLTVYCDPGSFAWNHLHKFAGIQVKPLSKMEKKGLFQRLFGKK